MNQLNKPPIYALHGTASSGAQWADLSSACLGKRHVITPDLPGYGQMQNVQEHGFEKRLQPLIADFLAINSQAHLVGHSFGAALVLRLAEMYPDRCLSVTLYEPTYLGVFWNNTRPNDVMLFRQIEALAKAVEVASPIEAMSYFIDFWMGKNRWQTLSLPAKQTLSGYAKLTAQDFSDGLFEASHSSTHAPYTGPTKLIYGENTAAIAKRICQLLAEKMPNACVEQLAGLGHMGPLQDPKTVNQVIINHIEKIE